LVIHGDGNQTRDFVHLDDVVEAMVAAATAPTIDQSVINIGSGVETSIREVAQYAIEATGLNVDWMYLKDQDPGSSRMCADIQQAQSKLGYYPRYDLREGLEKMVARDDRFRPSAQG
jgi:UDP-glucose 4-epimerase